MLNQSTHKVVYSGYSTVPCKKKQDDRLPPECFLPSPSHFGQDAFLKDEKPFLSNTLFLRYIL